MPPVNIAHAHFQTLVESTEGPVTSSGALNSVGPTSTHRGLSPVTSTSPDNVNDDMFMTHYVGSEPALREQDEHLAGHIAEHDLHGRS